MKFAVIENGVVVNIIKWDGQTPLGIELELVECTGQMVDIGYKCENGLFFKE